MSLCAVAAGMMGSCKNRDQGCGSKKKKKTKKRRYTIRRCTVEETAESSEEAPDTADQTIVDTAIAAGEFNTLVSLLKAADLVEALSGGGSFTVFAPSDEAFNNLPDGTLAELLKDEARLKSVLSYHVVSEALPASKIATRKSLETLVGQPLQIESAEGVKINGINLIKADVQCSNGIIHVIDAVLLP